VRHVRMLGLCLMALLAMAATTAVVASPALASCNEECHKLKEEEKQKAKEQREKEKEEAKKQKEREKEEAKKQEKLEEEAANEQPALETGVGDPWGASRWGAFQHCPWQLFNEHAGETVEGANGEQLPYITDCINGVTLGGKKGGYFEYGTVKVPLSKSIKLQAGATGEGEEVILYPAANGGETLEAPPMPVDGGISVITPLIQKQAKWPEALQKGFKEALKNGEKAIDVKIEMAGGECFVAKKPGCVDTEDILIEEGYAFKLPLKVTVTGPFLEKLGGGPCEIGSDEHPIEITLTTSGIGHAGPIEFNEEFTHVFLRDSRLVDYGWHISVASGAKGCGGEYESYVDEALNLALEVEYPGTGGVERTEKTGIVVLEGDLHDGQAEAVAIKGEKGEL